MNKEEALQQIAECSRLSMSLSWAKEVCKAFNVKLEDSIITKAEETGYREEVYKKVDRVAVYRLAESICRQLKIEPDEKTLHLAGQMSGQGSYVDLVTKACWLSLKK